MQGLPNLDLSSLAVSPRAAVFGIVGLILAYIFVQLVRMLFLTLGWSKPKPKGLFDGDLYWSKKDADFQVTLTDTVPARDEQDVKKSTPSEPVVSFSLSSAFSDRLAERTESSFREEPVANRTTRPAPLEYERAQRVVDSLERELENMKLEVGSVREEIQTLKQALQAEIHQMKMGQNASPIYSDAMQLALRGADANLISERCGIPAGEARLVVGMVTKQRQRA